MRHLMSCLLIGISFVLNAQTGVNTVWKKDLTKAVGPSQLEFNAVKATSAGVFAAGMISKSRGLQMYASFYSPTGNLLWDTIISTTNRAWVNFVDADANGNFYTGGVETVGSFNNRHVHIAKIDANGNLIWQKSYVGSMGEAELYGMKVVGNHIYVCGEQDSTNYPLAWVGKYDLNGNQVWAKTFDAGGGAWFDDLVVDNSGNVTAVGAADFGYSYLAVQFNSSGAINWQYPTNLSGTAEKYYTSIAQDGAGNIYMAGTEEAASSFDFDIVTTKLSSTGSLLWSKSYSTGDGYSGKILIGPNGNVHTFASTEDNFDYFAAVIQYDASGTQLWDIEYSIDLDSEGIGGQIDNSGNIYFGANDRDSTGIIKLSPTGNIIAKKIYSDNMLEFISDISIDGSSVAGVGTVSTEARVVALQNSDLTQTFIKQAMGGALGIFEPYALVADANSVWLASTTDAGDSCEYYITKMDGAGNVLWQSKDKYPCILSEFAHLQHDGNGNVIGFYTNQKTTSNYTSGLVKYDGNGNQLFKVLLDSAGAYEAAGLAIGNSGEIYVCGYNYVSRKMFVSRYSPAGVLVWHKFYKSPSTTFAVALPLGIKISPQGKLVIVASHRGVANVNDLHIFQYANDGSLEWHKDVDNVTGNLTSLNGLEIENNGDIVVFGTSGIGSYVLSKFDGSGAEVWSEKKPLATGIASVSMVVDASGNIYAGFSSSSNLIVRKLDGAGNFLTEKLHNFSSTGAFFFPRGMLWLNNQLVILGDHNYIGGNIPFEMLLDSQLNLVSTSTHFAEPGWVQAYAEDGAGSIYEVLKVPSFQGAYTYNSSVKKLSVGPLGLPELINRGESRIKLFPNPAAREITVILPLDQNSVYSLYLYNLDGKKLATFKKNVRLLNSREEVRIALPEALAPGSYLLVTESGGKQDQVRFIVLENR